MNEAKRNADPICGNCGKHLSEHYFENEVFCFTHTNGDIYTAEPPEQWVLDQMADRYPEIFGEIADEWRSNNLHA